MVKKNFDTSSEYYGYGYELTIQLNAAYNSFCARSRLANGRILRFRIYHCRSPPFQFAIEITPKRIERRRYMSDRKNNFEKITANQPKRTFSGPVMDERGNKDLPPGKKGGEKMKPDLHEIHKQHTFDSFCKKVLKHEAGNGHREINRRAHMEISMSDLPEEAMEQLAVYDDYPWDYTPFQVGDETVLVKDDRLAEALAAIPERERNIILLYWFLELADREIADRMGIARRTVNTHRQNAYRLLKKLMGGDADE